MNKEAIALAADSAVTMTTGSIPKIFPSANKIFTLSKYHPVGIMIYGAASFMGVPWETIIKIYRSKLCRTSFPGLEGYAKDFMNFIDNENKIFPESMQESFMREWLASYFIYINNKILGEVESRIKEVGQLNKRDTNQIITEVFEQQRSIWEKAEMIPDIPDDFEKEVLNKYSSVFDELIGAIFEKLPLSKKHRDQLKYMACSCLSKFSRELEGPTNTGIVIAGFGDNDIFPVLISYRLELVINNKVKYKMIHNNKISYQMSASIIPFAQSEMVMAFMEGVDPKYKSVKDSLISKIFDKYPSIIVANIEGYSEQEKQQLETKLRDASTSLLNDLSNRLDEYRRKNYTNPVINVVSGLPKDELAKMAESLVNLTSFKRRVSPVSETIGGPIDVAIISKGDGFIWVKRKHYFEGELNPQFRENYYGRCKEDEEIQ
jgi:hypothetical protein